jgi:riboflavin kinase/FMN adenylyltransferase
VAAGNFDGVHLGHREVFATAAARARKLNLPAVLLTFSSHPLMVVNPAAAPAPLMAVSDRLAIARLAGFDAAVVLDFDRELASMAREEFAFHMLVERIGARELVAGMGWRFGRGRSGEMEWLSRFGQNAGLNVWGVGPVMVDERPVSSTWVRESLALGDVAEVTRLLGRPHFVRGTVIRGEGRGRGLGFPTVNLDCHGLLIPARGVYAGGYRVGDAAGPAALSVGPAPTFETENGTAASLARAALEAHLIDMDSDLYGQTVTISFTRRLRDQRSFPDTDTLSRQIALDVETVRAGYRSDEFAEVPL